MLGEEYEAVVGESKHIFRSCAHRIRLDTNKKDDNEGGYSNDISTVDPEMKRQERSPRQKHA